MSVGGRKLPIALVIFLASCSGSHPPTPPSCARPSTDREAFLALYSVFAHVDQAVSRRTLPGWTPVPLPQAADWLRCDGNAERKQGRIRYATTRLAAGVVAAQRRGLSPRVVQSLLATIDRLIGQTTLVRQLQEAPSVDVSILEDEAGKIIDEAKDDPSLTMLQRTCCPCIDGCKVGPGTNEAIAEFTVKINRSPSCLFHVIDPQCWPSVVPGYVDETFLLDKTPCSGDDPVCRSGKICDPTLGDPQPLPMPPKAGTPWCGLLDEKVHAQSSGVTSKFENVLKVRTSYEPASGPPWTKSRMDYGLCESRSWEMCDTSGCKDGTCALAEDCGFAQVDGTGISGLASVDGAKHIQFKDGLPYDGNLWAPLALEVLVKETALALCEPASTSPEAVKPANCVEGPSPDKCKCPADYCTQLPHMSPIMATPFCP